MKKTTLSLLAFALFATTAIAGPDTCKNSKTNNLEGCYEVLFTDTDRDVHKKFVALYNSASTEEQQQELKKGQYSYKHLLNDRPYACPFNGQRYSCMYRLASNREQVLDQQAKSSK